jgi:hypothetical protein
MTTTWLVLICVAGIAFLIGLSSLPILAWVLQAVPEEEGRAKPPR